MYRAIRNVCAAPRGNCLITNAVKLSGQTRHGFRPLATKSSDILPRLDAPDLSYAQEPNHVHQVAKELQEKGMLKVSLQFPDPNCKYLEQLLLSLHKTYGHRLPITHSANRGWFWDVRPTSTNFQAGKHQARSETMNEFPWHTDCSYEDPPPRYFALQVLQHDRYGGGTLSVMSVECLDQLLSQATRSSLTRPEFQINVPPEFIKDPARRNIVSSLLVANTGYGSTRIRFREDIITPLSLRASQAFEELKQALQEASIQSHATLQLTAEDLPSGSIIFIDNRRWLHARNHINDSERHIRRVRWDAAPIGSGSH